MPLILHIETATKVCSVGLAENGHMLSVQESNEAYRHAESLGEYINSVLHESNRSFHDLSAIAVSIGPGSYTGLRIGLSISKGLCFAQNIPLISLSTLKCLAAGMLMTRKSELNKNDLICPMIDARRMEIYTAIYDIHLNEIEAPNAYIMKENAFTKYLKKGKLFFLGDGSEKCREGLQHHAHAVFVDHVTPSARFMTELALNSWKQKHFADLAYCEPFYLKEFLAGKPKKLL